MNYAYGRNQNLATRSQQDCLNCKTIIPAFSPFGPFDRLTACGKLGIFDRGLYCICESA